MLAFDSFVYLDLPKTGCTFLRETLKAICVDQPVQDIKHAPLQSMPPVPRIMTIRDPLNYLNSLWRYGLDGRGGFYRACRTSHPMAYADRSPRSFRCFLNLALSAGSISFGGQPLVVDIYTQRIINQLVPLADRPAFEASLDGDLSPVALMSRLQRFLPDALLRTESLNEDFHRQVNAGRLPFIPLKAGWQSLYPLDARGSNASSGDTGQAVSSFYDDWHRDRVLMACGLALALHERASAALA
jgi:hypothetical protein